jgi:1-acyl-sn-glycerol-3-phosphate acyltransferase
MYLFFPFKCILFISWCFFFTYILPIFAYLGFLLGFAKNPWDFNTELIHLITNTQILNIQEVSPPLIRKGVIVTNHRSFADFYLDPHLFSCPCITRRMAGLVSEFFFVISLFYNRVIVIDRNQKRDTLFSYIQSLKKELFMFYLEGTRCSHIMLPENYKEVVLKYGLLKSMWEHEENTCLQIVISKNKEKVLNEKKMIVGFGQKVY